MAEKVIRYVTRWALSTGIRRVRGEYLGSGRRYFCGPGGLVIKSSEAFVNLEDAIAQARDMAALRVASLRKTIAKLEDQAWAPKVVDCVKEDA